MSIVEKVAYITWTPTNKIELERLGYLFTNYNETLEIAEQHGIQFGLILKEKLYEVVMNSSNKKILINNGYEWTRVGQSVLVKPEHLTKGSHTKVMCICDFCNKVIFPTFKDYYRTTKGGTKKQKCSECGNSVRKKTSVYITQLFKIHKGEIILIGEYEGAHQKTLHKHLICNFEWTTRPHDLLKGEGCPKCNGNSYVDDSNNLFSKYPELKLIWDYNKNSLDPLKIRPYSNLEVWWICLVDSTHSYQKTVSKKVEGQGCPYCSGRNVHPSNCLATTHPYLIEQWDPLKNTITPFDVTYGSNTPVFWLGQCDHGGWSSSVKRMVRGEGCPYCNESKGERYIRESLENMNMEYISQKKFDDLKYSSHLLFDFYVHIEIGEILIEFHGEQHYKFNEFFYSNRAEFKRRLKLDGLKRNYAKKNNMKFIVIPYKINGKKYDREETLKYLYLQLYEFIISFLCVIKFFLHKFYT